MAKTKRKAPKRKPTTAIARRPVEAIARPETPGILGVFERFARDPDLTVEKLGELIRLQERIVDREATSAFDQAYREMLPEIPRITKRGIIRNKAKEVQSRYSRYEDLRKTCDPILRGHGFTFHTRTEWPQTGVLEVVGVLEHRQGGRRESRFRANADESGGKNAIQGLGSGVSYGKRYTYKDLLSIVEEGVDDDGQAHGAATVGRGRESTPPARTPPVDVPAGHDGGSKEPITDGQLRRFHAIVSNSGRGELEVRTWLDQRFGWSSSRQITRDKYDTVCSAIEAPGPLA